MFYSQRIREKDVGFKCLTREPTDEHYQWTQLVFTNTLKKCNGYVYDSVISNHKPVGIIISK